MGLTLPSIWLGLTTTIKMHTGCTSANKLRMLYSSAVHLFRVKHIYYEIRKRDLPRLYLFGINHHDEKTADGIYPRD